MIILNESFRRVNAKGGGTVGGEHPLYPEAGRSVSADDLITNFSLTSDRINPIIGLGVIRSVADDTGDGQFGEWDDLSYDWENGINKWEIRRITVAIEVKSASQIIRQPNILFDIESSAEWYLEKLRTASLEFGLHQPIELNVELRKAIDLWSNTSHNWESLNELIIWSDAMYPPRTITDTASSLFGIRSNSYWLKDSLIRRTANLLLDLQSSSSFQLSVFGDWDTSVNNWQNLYTVWPTFSPRTITDTASASVELRANSYFYIDTIISRSATIAFDVSASSSFTISTIFTRTSSSTIGIASSVSGQVISFSDWQTAGINWESTSTLWDVASTGQTITDTASSLISISSNSDFLIDKLIKRTANVAFDISSQSINYNITTANWVTTSVQWQSQSLLWDTASTGYTITDTASASMSLKSSNIYSDFTYGWNTDTSNWENQYDTWPIVWTPAEISTVAWYDPSEGNTSTSYLDKSGNGYNLSQVTAGRTLAPVNTRTFNGRGVYEYGAGTQNTYVLENNSFNYNLATNNLVISLIIRLDIDNTLTSTHADFIFELYDGASTSVAYRTFARRINGDYIQLLGGDGVSTARSFNTPNGSFIHGVDYLLTFVLRGANSDMRIQGSVLNTGTLNQTIANSINLGHNMVEAQSMHGFIGEVVFHDSLTDVEKVEGYLAHKWGMVGNLPSSHPYKVLAP